MSVDRREPFLSARLSDELYLLYQAGKTCEEIFDLNRQTGSSLSLGMIVRARIDFKWDEKRQTYLQGMFERARTQAAQLSLESLSFIGDVLRAFHRHDQEKLQRFVQTGNSEELNGSIMLNGGGLKIYKDVLDLLMRLTTGSDGGKKPGEGKKLSDYPPYPVVEAPPPPAPAPQPQPEPLPVLPEGKPIEPQAAAQVLEFIHRKRQGQ